MREGGSPKSCRNYGNEESDLLPALKGTLAPLGRLLGSPIDSGLHLSFGGQSGGQSSPTRPRNTGAYRRFFHPRP